MLIAPAAYAADEVTITGVVFSSKGIIRIADGQEYTIAIDEMGVDLIDEDRKKVEVQGTVEEEEGKKIINVKFCKFFQCSFKKINRIFIKSFM